MVDFGAAPAWYSPLPAEATVRKSEPTGTATGPGGVGVAAASPPPM